MTQEVTHRETREVPPDEFRYRLLLARLHRGLTTRQAAEQCGLNYVSWSNWERGKVPRDRADVARAVSDGLGMDLDWLLWGGQLAKETRRRGGQATVPSLRTPVARIHQAGRTDTSRGAIRRTGRKIPLHHPMAA